MSYTAQGKASAAIGIAKATTDLIADPHLPEVVCHISRLNDLEEGRIPGPPCKKVSTTAYPGKGVGLRHAIKPIRLFVWSREHPVAAIAVGAGILMGLVGLGYALGRQAR